MVNQIGSGATAVAFGFFLYERTGSAVWLSIWYFFSFGIAGLLTPVAGWLADRFDRRRIIIVSQLLCAVCSLALIVVQDPVTLVAIAFVDGIISRAAWTSFSAGLPNLTGEESLEWANGRVSALGHVGSLLGPVIGGALYATAGRSVVFSIDALTFVVAAFAAYSIRLPFNKVVGSGVGEEEPDLPGGVLEGFRIVFKDPIFRVLSIIWALGYFAVDIVLVGELPLATALGASALAFGILQAAWGGGVIAGSLVGGRLREDQDLFGILVGIIGVSGGLVLSAISPWFAPLVILMVGIGASSSVWEVVGYAMMQRGSTDEVRGRVMSTFSTVGLIANAIAFAIAGPITQAFGPRIIYVLGALAAALCLPFVIAIRRRRPTPTPTPTPEVALRDSDGSGAV